MLLLLALPALDLRLNASGVELLPEGAEQRVFFERVEEEFTALDTPAVTVAAQADVEQVAAWIPELEALPGVLWVTPPKELGPWPASVDAPGSDPDGPGLVTIGIQTEGGDMGDAAREVVRTLQGGETAGFPTWVTGQTASLVDFTDSVGDRAPWAALWIASATFLLLFLLTGSVVIPLKALVLNVVSLGASLGVTRVGLPVGSPRVGAALQLRRRDRVDDPAAGARVRVRALDGLRGVPAGPDHRAARAGVRRRHRRPARACSAPGASSPRPR